jgi:ABC-type nitrate/sulfonate/bicarbonate transport system permease component
MGYAGKCCLPDKGQVYQRICSMWIRGALPNPTRNSAPGASTGLLGTIYSGLLLAMTSTTVATVHAAVSAAGTDPCRWC